MLLFVRLYPDTIEYKKEDMVSDYLSILEHRMNKHMLQWKKRHLPFVLGGDSLPAAYFANWMLDQPQPDWMPNTYNSDIHNTVVNVRACGAFLVSDEKSESHKGKHFFNTLTRFEQWLQEQEDCGIAIVTIYFHYENMWKTIG